MLDEDEAVMSSFFVFFLFSFFAVSFFSSNYVLPFFNALSENHLPPFFYFDFFST